ncbi:flavin reductase [Conexibacter sp. CPCC 206217]|uniref:flavin reductase n=1 Tax=Conexibacter sp. CPCC 206217 TaxID=3064574 RepID=UPI00272303E5|nr:flavin reductase [Conexibacter sp. CPCC 206217]MDO8210200.1 flavin reductase [Conexibacter sp. CPCC 206217]
MSRSIGQLTRPSTDGVAQQCALRRGQPLTVGEVVVVAAEAVTPELLGTLLEPDAEPLVAVGADVYERLGLGHDGTAVVNAFSVRTGRTLDDRARTIRALARRDASATDFFAPGHVRCVRGERAGSDVSAALELLRGAGLAAAGLVVDTGTDDRATRAGGGRLDRAAPPPADVPPLPAPPPPDAETFRAVLGHLPTGVTVITAAGPVGMACNSFCSVSLRPALVAFCAATTSSTWPRIQATGRFCVNVMACGHGDLTRAFSRRGVDRFADVASHQRLGGPGLDEAVAWIDCEIEAEHRAGDHMIVVGRVIGLEAAAEREPLVFSRGGFGRYVPE